MNWLKKFRKEEVKSSYEIFMEWDDLYLNYTICSDYVLVNNIYTRSELRLTHKELFKAVTEGKHFYSDNISTLYKLALTTKDKEVLYKTYGLWRITESNFNNMAEVIPVNDFLMLACKTSSMSLKPLFIKYLTIKSVKSTVGDIELIRRCKQFSDLAPIVKAFFSLGFATRDMFCDIYKPEDFLDNAPHYIRYVQYYTTEQWIKALSKDGRLLQYLPDHLHNDYMSSIALKNNIEAYHFIKDKKDIFITYFLNNGGAL